MALCTDDERECYDCIYKDLCHTEFVKRSLEEKPTVEEKPLDSIHMTPSQRRFVEFESGECRVNAGCRFRQDDHRHPAHPAPH